VRPRTLEEIAAAIGGGLRAPGAERATALTVTTDSRTARPGALFVALAGESSDGHVFVRAALEAGAAGALVRSGAPVEGDPARLIEVDDPALGLLDLARDERSSIGGLVVGVTGSTGKTCTKDFLASVLGQRFRVVASPASFNNEVGLPLTLLSVAPDTEAIVCEMGARGPGHIRLLCEVAQPSFGVVTNVGVAHMELFGSPEVLRDSKAELPESLPADGAAILNADDPVVRSYRDRTPARTVLYGVGYDDADVRGRDVTLERETGRAGFVLVTPEGAAAVRLPVPGEHMVPNALAAAAAGWAAGMSAEEIARGLETASVSAGRMQVFDMPGGVRLIDDAYNANPASMAAALRAARWMAGDGRCVAVLGHMAELGPISVEEHERVGELLVRLGIDELVTVGEQATVIAVGAEREGVEPQRIHRASSAEDALEVLRELVRPGDVVLVKASRVARLERLAEALRSARPSSVAVEAGPGSKGGGTA
jgi:UDP-N-acetylmuramoyl-tripeptide--D-alanyl-D-alanine ligase